MPHARHVRPAVSHNMRVVKGQDVHIFAVHYPGIVAIWGVGWDGLHGGIRSGVTFGTLLVQLHLEH